MRPDFPESRAAQAQVAPDHPIGIASGEHVADEANGVVVDPGEILADDPATGVFILNRHDFLSSHRLAHPGGAVLSSKLRSRRSGNRLRRDRHVEAYPERISADCRGPASGCPGDGTPRRVPAAR